MLKRSLFPLSIFFISSMLYATQTVAPATPETTKIKQQEVDLATFQNEEVLRFAVLELSKNVPKVIDKYTTLVDVTKKGLSLVYVYEINTGSKSDAAVRKEDHERMRRAVTQGTCKSSKRFLQSGIALSYLYNSAKSKEKLFQIDVRKKDCPSLR